MRKPANSAPLFLFSFLITLAAPVRAQDAGLGSDDYIKSHFYYSDFSRVNVFQRNPLPSGARARPCSPQVFPASPGQMTKAYHVDALMYFDPNKVHAEGKTPAKTPAMAKEGISTEENYCFLPNNNNRNKNPATGTLWCVKAKAGRYVIMSDVFHDTCGNYFRGIWETAAILDQYTHGKPQYTSMGEHSVTTSIGRYDGMEKDPQFSSSYNFIPGPTGPMDLKRFLFFTEATADDMLNTNKALEQSLAPRGRYYRCKDGTYSQEKEHCVQ